MKAEVERERKAPDYVYAVNGLPFSIRGVARTTLIARDV